MVPLRSTWLLALFSAFSPVIFGDDVKGATGAINGTTPTASEGEITVHFISVSEELHLFTPNSINALPGDVVSFRFWPGNHSVIRAEYGYPCIPYEDLEGHSGQGFYSEVQSPNATDVELGTLPVWNLTINDTSPTFFYCGAPGSCVQWGMIGAINADAEHPIATQIKVAREANYVLTPGQPLPTDAYTSMEHLAQSATTVTVTNSAPTTSASTTSAAAASATATSDDGGDSGSGSSGLSTGAIVGIVIGGVALLALAGGLFYFFGRSKTLSEQLQHSRASAPPPPQDPYNRHTSGLPAYTQVVPQYPPEMKPQGPIEADGGIIAGQGHGSPHIVSPEMRQAETFGGLAYSDPQNRQMRFSSNSEMLGSDVSRQASPPPHHIVHEMSSEMSPRSDDSRLERGL